MALGINKGDHVAIWSTNYPEWVAAQFGAVLVTVNPAYRTHELEFLLNQSDAVALMLIGNFRTSDYAAMLAEVAPELANSVPGRLRSEKLPRLRNVIFIPPHDGTAAACPPGMFAWADLAGLGEEISASALAQRQSGCHPDDVICIMYTSGTTGNPKGVMLTHHNLVANAAYTMQGLRFTQDDRLCIPVPFYHCFGSVLGTLACAATAAAMVIPSEYFDPGKALVAVEKERCTAIHGVPTMFIAELEHPDFDRFDLRSLRTGIMAGSPCPIKEMHRKNGPKFTYLSDLREFWDCGKSLVVYQHINRNGKVPVQIERVAAKIADGLPDAEPIPLLFHRGSARVFFVIPNPESKHSDVVRERANRFAADGPWRANGHFERFCVRAPEIEGQEG